MRSKIKSLAAKNVLNREPTVYRTASGKVLTDAHNKAMGVARDAVNADAANWRGANAVCAWTGTVYPDAPAEIHFRIVDLRYDGLTCGYATVTFDRPVAAGGAKIVSVKTRPVL